MESSEEKVDMVDSLVFSDGFEWVERWVKNVRYALSIFQILLYILEVNEDFIEKLEAGIQFAIDVESRHRVVLVLGCCQRRCRRLY